MSNEYQKLEIASSEQKYCSFAGVCQRDSAELLKSFSIIQARING